MHTQCACPSQTLTDSRAHAPFKAIHTYNAFNQNYFWLKICTFFSSKQAKCSLYFATYCLCNLVMTTTRTHWSNDPITANPSLSGLLQWWPTIQKKVIFSNNNLLKQIPSCTRKRHLIMAGSYTSRNSWLVESTLLTMIGGWPFQQSGAAAKEIFFIFCY